MGNIRITDSWGYDPRTTLEYTTLVSSLYANAILKYEEKMHLLWNLESELHTSEETMLRIYENCKKIADKTLGIV